MPGAETTHSILLAHGSPDPRWRKTFEDGLASIAPRLQQQAHLAYMEFAEPSLETIIAEQYQNNARRFTIAPLFLAAGRHLLTDVPAQIATLESQFPGISVELLAPVGTDSGFWDFLLELLNRP